MAGGAGHTKERIGKAVATLKVIGGQYGILGLDKKGIIAKYGMYLLRNARFTGRGW